MDSTAISLASRFGPNDSAFAGALGFAGADREARFGGRRMAPAWFGSVGMGGVAGPAHAAWEVPKTRAKKVTTQKGEKEIYLREKVRFMRAISRGGAPGGKPVAGLRIISRSPFIQLFFQSGESRQNAFQAVPRQGVVRLPAEPFLGVALKEQ